MVKFIEVTKKYKETKVLVNLGDISLIESNDKDENETDIIFKDGGKITIKESYDFIKDISWRITND